MSSLPSHETVVVELHYCFDSVICVFEFSKCHLLILPPLEELHHFRLRNPFEQIDDFRVRVTSQRYIWDMKCVTRVLEVVRTYSDFLLIEGLLGFVAQFLAPCEILIWFVLSRRRDRQIIHSHDIRVFRWGYFDFGVVHWTIVQVSFCNLGLMRLLELDECRISFANHDFDLGDISVDPEEIEELFWSHVCDDR